MAAKQDAGGCGLLNLEFERNRGMGFPKKKLRALMGGLQSPIRVGFSTGVMIFSLSVTR